MEEEDAPGRAEEDAADDLKENSPPIPLTTSKRGRAKDAPATATKTSKAAAGGRGARNTAAAVQAEEEGPLGQDPPAPLPKPLSPVAAPQRRAALRQTNEHKAAEDEREAAPAARQAAKPPAGKQQQPAPAAPAATQAAAPAQPKSRPASRPSSRPGSQRNSLNGTGGNGTLRGGDEIWALNVQLGRLAEQLADDEDRKNPNGRRKREATLQERLHKDWGGVRGVRNLSTVILCAGLP